MTLASLTKLILKTTKYLLGLNYDCVQILKKELVCSVWHTCGFELGSSYLLVYGSNHSATGAFYILSSI